jgi:hypothetical protein
VIAGTILTLDLGKYKTVARLATGDPTTARFDSLTTDRQHLRQLFARQWSSVYLSDQIASSLPLGSVK